VDLLLWAQPGGVPHPPLEGDHTADLAIVGGGYTGLLTALAIRARHPERRIVLLEAGVCGDGASGRNAGMAVPGATFDLDRLEGLLGTDRARAAVAWLAEGPRRVASTARRLGIPDAVEETGSLSLARTARHERAQHELLPVYRRLGVDAEVLDLAATRRTIGSPLYRSAFHVAQGVVLVEPGRLVRALREAVIAAGVTIHENTPVTTIDPGNPIRLTTPRGRLTAPAMVLATNAWAPRLGFFRNRVAPVHVACIATAPLDPARRAALAWNGRQAIWEEGRVYHFLRLTPDDRVLIGGGGGAYVAGDGLDYHGGPADFRRLEAALVRIFPALTGLPVTHRWTGPIGFARDFLPSFGATGPHHNIYYGVGYTGHGVALSHLAADLIAARYSGEPPPDAARWLVDRRFPWLLAGPLKWVAINAVRNGWMALDRLGL
jgi:glycine/D-amino acid oxidase-like deaminating enzyme